MTPPKPLSRSSSVTARSTTAAAAPRASAAPAKSWPSTCSPRRAKKSSPPSTLRESRVARVHDAPASPPSSVPLIATAASPTVRRIPALLEGLLGFLAVRKRVLDAGDLLAVFVPLAGDQDGPRGPGDGHRAPDGVAAVGQHAIARVAARLHALLDGAHDGLRVFAAGVVGGGDDQVGELTRDLSHQRPLAGVAIAAAAEHHHHATFRRDRAHGGERV